MMELTHATLAVKEVVKEITTQYIG